MMDGYSDNTCCVGTIPRCKKEMALSYLPSLNRYRPFRREIWVLNWSRSCSFPRGNRLHSVNASSKHLYWSEMSVVIYG